VVDKALRTTRMRLFRALTGPGYGAAAARKLASQTGAITLLVSHRFSTVRMADLIVVLDQGRVAASGDHDTLVRAGGLYAELYEMQARSYR
jgi:ATP-binding cassette, subfamily B, bacterial